MNKIPDKHLTFLICLALALSTFFVFLQVRNNQFISFDDDWYIYDNSQIKSGLTLDNVRWAFSHDHAGNFHPLTTISHMLDCNLYDLNPGAHHLTNLLFHLANVLLLFLVLKKMTVNLWASAFIAALFALHPLHVESVVWASERKDVLSTFFAFLTMAAYTRYTRKPGLFSYSLSLLLFALGLLAKPMLVTLPFLLLLLDYWPLKRVTPEACFTIRVWRKPIIEKIPFLVLAVIISGITLSVQKNAGIVQDVVEYPLLLRVENAFVVYMTYIVKLFVPVNLAIFYPYPRNGISVLRAGLALFPLVSITILALWQMRKRPWLIVGWLWFVISLLPVIGLVQVGLQAWADRYTYTSYIGLFIIVAWGIPELFSRFRYRKLILASLAGAAISVLTVLTWLQVGYWKDNETLYGHAVKVVKDNWWARRCFGQEYVIQGKFDQAVEQFTEALRIYPGNMNIQNDLAETLLKQGKTEQAIKLYEEFIVPLPEDVDFSQLINDEFSRQPGVAKARRFFAKAYVNLATALTQQGKYGEAVKYFTSALYFEPKSVYMVKEVANSFLSQGRLKDAQKLYQKILYVLPGDLDVHNNLGITLAQEGRFDEAIEQFVKAVTIDPNSAESHSNLGFALLTTGRFKEAELNLTEAVRLSPDLSDAHFRLGVLHQLQKRIGEAVGEFRRVLKLSPDRTDAMDSLARLILVYKDADFYDPNEAMRLAENACKATNYQNPEFLDTLAIACAANGRFTDAVETAEKALKSAQSAQNEPLALQIQSRLDLYKADKPYIEPAPKIPAE